MSESALDLLRGLLEGGYEDPPEDPPPKGVGGVAGRRVTSNLHDEAGGRGASLSPLHSCPCQPERLALLVARRVLQGGVVGVGSVWVVMQG